MEKVVNFQQLSASYKEKKVFVTGHTGFKGAWLVAWLHQMGAIVKGYALAPEHNKCLYNHIKSAGIMETVIADIRNKEKLTEEILSFTPDYIFHLAAQPLVRRSFSIPAETFEINTAGTANLLEAVNKLAGKCSIVIVTSDKVYENKEQDILYNEEDILGGYDPYSASKACTEIVVDSFRVSFFNVNNSDYHHKAIASARAGNVIGGGDWSKNRIIPDTVKALLKKETIKVRNPDSVRPWQHVLEPLSGYLLLGGYLYDQPALFSKPYNFGPYPEDHLTVKQLVELAIQIWGDGKMEINGSVNKPHEANLLQLDIHNAITELKWKPKLSAEEAVRWTMEWYKTDISRQVDFTFKQIENFLSK